MRFWSKLFVVFICGMMFVGGSIGVSNRGAGEYEQRADFNGDGIIDIFDIVYIAGMYGTTGSNTVVLNGGFETGTFANWWKCPSDFYSAHLESNIVHSGNYSAYVSDQRTYNNWIRQDIYVHARVPADSGFILEGWIYPTKVGKLAGEFPYSGIRLLFCNESSMEYALHVIYSWCASTTWTNKTARVNYYLPGWGASDWNFLSRNVTSDIYVVNSAMNLSGIVLYSVEAYYHYSSGSPGPFYVDDLQIIN